MTICDICKTNRATYNTSATISDEGDHKTLELCGPCYKELERRQEQHGYLAYVETIEARNGQVPPRRSWFAWRSKKNNAK